MSAWESGSPNTLKYRLPVTFSVTGGAAVSGWVSLQRHSEFRRGPQTLLERLNERVRVLPVVEREFTHLVSRALIEWAEPGEGVDAGLVGPSSYAVTHEERASVQLASGETLEGIVEIEMPHGYNRTSDFINGEDDFFALRCAERTLLVNKRRIRDLRLGVTSHPDPA
jgi:hypothetical protein